MDISTFSSVTKHFFDKLMDGALHKLEQKPYANTRISTAAGFNISSSTSAPSIQPQPANLNMEATDPLQTRRHSLRDTPPAAPAPYPTQVKGRRPIFPQTIPPVCAPMVSLNISFFTNSTDKTYGNFARSNGFRATSNCQRCKFGTFFKPNHNSRFRILRDSEK